jgi:hypothetical protein
MKLKIPLISAALVAVLMAATNPSKERYSYYASEEFAERGKTFLCSLDILDNNYKQLCAVAIPVSKPIIKPIFELLVGKLTTQQNLILFSIFTTEFPGKKVTTIGAFGNFLMIR